jgi:hypothetical protein
MNKKELKEKVDNFINNMGGLSLNWKQHLLHPNNKEIKDKYDEQYSEARRQLIELLDIKTHEHQNTDIFK